MSNPTSNFGWQMPTPTDLVTDLPADFEVFGQAVDSSLADLKGGTSGQILAKNSNTDMDFVWTSANPGDITGVTAGTGISGGGTSGDVTITNSMATEITAKGDLIVGTGSATFDNLAAGANGSTLVADSSTSTGLRYQVTQAAGKNYLINGAMDIWQRGTSYALPAAVFNYGAADRWGVYANSVTGRTISRQTSGLAGFTYSQRVQRDSGNTNTQNTQLAQIIESSVATSLQSQYVTVSFWAKAGANYSVASSNITIVLYAGTGTDQNPYTSGYTGQTTPISTSQAITTSWAKYSFTTSAVLASTITELTLSIQSGAFVGTAGANDWFEVTGVQLEAGQTGTLFTRAGGTIQGELAACQRYYWRTTTQASSTDNLLPLGMGASTTEMQVTGNFPVRMRTNPTAVEFAGLRSYDTNAFVTITGVTIGTTTLDCYLLSLTAASGLVQYRPTQIRASASVPANAYVGFSAEL